MFGLARPRSRLPAAECSGAVHLLHIGKTGGTAIKAALKPHRAAARLRFHPHKVKLSDIPEGERAVFFLRDPISRFASAFHSRLRQGQPRYFSRWSPAEAEAFAVFHTPDALGAALTSADPQLRKRAEAAMRGIQHVRSPLLYWFGSERAFRKRFDDILFIGFQEQLDADFDALKRLLDVPAEAALPTDAVRSHRNPAALDRSLSPAALANLQNWYADDIRFYALCRGLRAERFADA